MKHIQGFSKRYENLPLPTSGQWFERAKYASKLLSQGGTVCLFGSRGTGKSFMAWDLAHNSPLPDPHEPDGTLRHIINLTAMGLFMAIRNSWREASQISEVELFRKWTDAALLVIDEIQERGETAFENQKLTAIVDARYMAMRPTLIIGNFDNAAQMSVCLGPSIVSRVQECGGALQCKWPSYREVDKARTFFAQ